jgi:hypothetical protein
MMMAKVARTKVLKGAVFVVVLGLAGGAVVNTFGASAITYEGSANVGFEITDSINLSISGDITIPELLPGNSADSNAVNITVSTNASSGYTLSAKMATASSDLTASGISGGFTSVDASGSGVSSLTSGKWGYKVLTGSGGVWSDYLGLPVSSSDAKILADTDTMPSGGSAVTQFKIGANAGSSMSAGAYTNSITFYAVAKQVVSLCGSTKEMQSIDSTYINSMTTDAQVQMCDARDGKTYYVSKLADGNVWMTQNLDLDLSSTTALTPTNTNITDNWTPSISTYTTGADTWNNSSTEPESYDPGDLCWNGNLNTSWDGTLDTETVACTSSNMNYHIGNYYNWTAAVAMNDSSAYEEDETLVGQSICPVGWTLPLSGGNTGSGSFSYLLDQYDSTGIWEAPLSFVLGGGWDGSSGSVASVGFYWSSVVYDSNYAYYLYFNSGDSVDPQNNDGRVYGFSVRCVASP